MRKHCTLLFLLSLCLSSYAQGIDLKADTWVASDALGRIMPTATNNPLRTDKTRTVGIFYITWHDEGKFGLRSPYGGDVTRTLKEAPEARLDAYHPAWKEWSLHWGEPEAGYFLSQDRWLIRRDLSMLADAGVDVLILDVTNAVLYWDEWNVLFDEMQKMRSLGNPVPQFCFWAFNGNVVSVVTQLFERIYKKGIAQDFWFQWQGKPLLLYNAEPDHDANGGGYDSGSYPQEIYDFFTLRNMWWGYYEWGGHRYVGTEDSWSFGYEMNDKRVADMKPIDLASRHQGRLEEMAVTPAQHPISITGKSWRRETQEPTLNQYDLPDSAYVPWLGKTVNHPEGYGIYFQDRWDEALSVDPDFIYINDWNEWTAGKYRSGLAPGSETVPGPTTFLGRENPFYFVDQYNAEFNRSIQPMKGGYTDNYYMQMVQNIRRYKGVRPQPTTFGYNTTATYYDTRGDIIHRDHNGYGGLHYTDTTGRNDIIETHVRVTKKDIIFEAITAETLSPSTGKNWMLLYLDADTLTPGWEGFDYMVSEGQLQRYDAATQHWHAIVPVSQSAEGNRLAITIPRKNLRLKGNTITLDFKWADNPTAPLDIISISTTGDTAPNRRFRYHFKWSAQRPKSFDLTHAMVDKIADLQGVPKQGYQGMAIWDKYLVSLQNTGLATIYRLHKDSLQFIRQFPLASNTKENHANVAFFGTERFDKEDEFPLLYVSQCSKQRYKGMKDVCFVERISLTGQPQLVQTIVLDDKEGLFGYALQWMIDRKHNLLIGYGNTIENMGKGNRWRTMIFKMPKLSQGPVVHLNPKDAIDNYCIQDLDPRFPSNHIGQGACIINDQMFIPVGLGTEQHPSIIYVWNMKKKHLDNILDFQQQVPHEFEDCEPYENTLIMQTNGGGLIRFTPYDH